MPCAFLVHSFAVSARLPREMTKFQVTSLLEIGKSLKYLQGSLGSFSKNGLDVLHMVTKE